MTAEVDFQAVACGPPRAGKSTLARALVARWLSERPSGLVLAHDPMRQFRAVGSVAAPDAAHARRELAAAAKARRPAPRAWSCAGSAPAVLALALELGRRHNTAGAPRLPLFVVVDESSLLSSSGSSWIAQADQEALATRRHLGLGLLFLTQRRTMLTGAFYSGCTDLYLFAQQARDAAAWEEVGHLPRGTLAGLPDLPRYSYVHVRPGDGVVGDAL